MWKRDWFAFFALCNNGSLPLVEGCFFVRKLTEVTTSVNWQNSGRGLALLLKTKEGKSMEGKRLGQTRAKRFKRHQRLTILKSTEITIIDSECFKNFTNLREIKICEGVRVIGDGAFKNCTALR
ncbi:MAG: leucine-rich repeat protein, partial [Eubacterium sp.]